MKRPFGLAALNPPGTTDAAIPIAAGRAGGLGILDLTLAADAAAAASALEALARHGRGSLGARLDSTRPDLVERVADALPAAVETVLLMPGESGALREAVALLRPRVRTLLMEATSLDEALEGAGLGVDGLIARGHEAAGRVGDETTFILLQRLLARSGLPVWAWGGIGLHSATACYAAGAAGVVLDLQLALTRESPLPSRARSVLRRMDGSETTTAGGGIGEPVRVYDRQGLPPVLQLHRAAAELETDTGSRLDRLRTWRRRVRELAGWGPPERHLWLVGQDAAFAAPLASRFRTVGGILEGMRGAIDENIATSAARRPLDAGSPLARSHGTTYPIVQGPMTRVSDNAAFALEVARGGALPFLALALMRAPEVRDLLRETRDRLGERPWGVGILGFVPLELRQEQLEVIREFRPPFALIAGGRPDQARALEEDGIRTYLHVPSPGLLEMFLENGARRFVFEGRECGGHVGPRSSFVLWNGMVDTLLESLPDDDLSSCHVLFAAGIHDALSSSMVAAMAAPLAARGARIGVLLGTSYLFTREAVATGAIVEGFQKEAIRCERTVLLETGPGHATRCTDSPYARTFEEERRRLLAEGHEPESVRNALEALNLGRLRIASKGVDRHPRYGRDPDAPKLVPLGTDEQTQSGMFMIGQVAALRSATCTIEELHRDVSIAGSARLADLERPRLSAAASRPERPLDVAIVGMACLLPGAPGLRSFWRNILGKVDAITEIPGDRWDWRRYFDDKPRARDRIYSRWGGFLDETPFDPMRYGMPPSSLASIEPLQLLTLEVSRAALQDAGYLDRPFDRRHTSVILGAGGGVSDLGALYAFRSLLPSFIQDPPEAILKRLPEWTEDSFPGILLNVAAGRVANRFDLGGLNCTIDAACASSLAAVYMASKELETGASDMVIVGGADTAQNPFMYLCFSQTGAHSGSGRCRTFDEGADGIAISEGIAVMVMKRLADAERDGDRIYAVLKAIAASSDGRDRGLTAPRPEGQALALERAYRQAGFSPATVGLIEAHGTGTVAGDQAEVTTLRRVFESAGAGRHDCAIGSVKSMIGHTKCTAGVAGMIKATLALHHRLLPPTLHVESPNRKASFADSPLYVNSEVRPWIRTDPDRPRRAGVSAFGFGGTNFHAVLEEYADSIPGTVTTDLAWDRPAEIFLWRGATRDELVRQVASVAEALARGADPQPDALARALHDIARDRDGAPGPSCAIVASSIADLRDKIDLFREAVSRGAERSGDPSGVYFTAEPLAGEGRIAFLFPGQGSQYPGMLADLAARFAIVRERFELAGSVLRERLPEHLGRYVFPPPSFGPEQERASKEALTATNVAQPALGAAGMAAFHLLSSFGVRPDMAAGHSYGEYVALCAAGVIDEQSLAMISEARGRSIIESAKEDLGTMAAAACEAGRIRDVLGESGDVWIANLNAPRQTVLSGSRRGIERAAARLQEAGITLRPIPVACAFHSPLVAPAGDRLSASLATLSYSAPRFPVYSNASAAPYPGDAHGIRRLLSDHLVSPVRFADEIRAMHDAGARIFVEAGPRDVLSGLTRQILEGRPHLAVSADSPGRPGLLHLLHLLARLAVHGVPLRLDPLFGRIESSEQAAEDAPDLAALLRQDGKAPLSPAVWMVGGGHARPIGRDRPASAPAPLALEGRRPEGTVEIAPAEARADEATRSARRPLVASPAAAGPPSPMTQILKEYQETMNRFLDTQRAVMQAYLTGTPLERRDAPEAAAQIPAGTTPETESTAEARPGVAPPESEAAAPASAAAPAPGAIQPPAAPDGGVRERLLSIVAERTGYPAEMLDLDLNIEADLGIDSIKRVEILGALQRQSDPAFAPRLQAAMEELTRARTLRAIIGIAGALESSGDGDTGAATNGEPAPAAAAGKASTDARSPAPPAAAAPEATATPAARHGGVRERLLSIVAERTGYPAEMLDLDLNIEADLGIDSIKRVEILGALQRQSDPAFAPRLQGAMEELTRAKTLRAIIGIAGALESSGDGDTGAATNGEPAPAAAAGKASTDARSPAPPAAAAPEATATPAAPHGGVRERLLSIVAERTGYPAEMLDLDLNIEADLGIDSIKRVEILGALQRQSDPAFAPRLQAAMEELTRARTLRAIIGIAGALESSGDGDTGAATNGEPAPAAAAGKASTDARSPAPPAAAAPEATATPAARHGGVRERLLSIVAERTGYPAEMLDLDLNIEADLGIDSIKRVEILGALQRRSDPAFAPRLQGAMEELTRARTLRAIIGIAGALEAAGDRPAASAGAETTAEATRPPDVAQAAAVPRFLTRLVEATPGGGSPAALPRAPILITDDGGGIARTLAEDLRRAGAVTALIRPGPESTEAEPGIFTADLLAPRGAEALIEIVTERLGVPAGIIHLLPLGRPPGAWRDSIGAWKNGIDRDVKSLFRLARAASPSLRTAGRAGGALLFAATSLDGGGREPDGGEPRFPGRGGVAGLIRTLAVEWPEVRCRAVDLGRRDGTDASARRILRELLEDDREIDIAYRDGRRLVPRPVEAPLPDARPDAPRIARDSVILITGGARGITAEVAREIAARHGPTLVLVGRSPLSADPEPPEIREIDAPHELKAALIEIARRSGATPRPAEIEAAVGRLLREREIRRNLEAIGRHGARAHYVAADVRDDAALGELLDRIEREHGRIDGVIHGAGLIEDRLIEDKTPESFDRVFDTKADGAFILSRRLRRDALRFFVLFASVAGRFGNRGQCDYAAANEALNDLAAALDHDLPGRVVAINWGPWGRTGMASAEVQRRFAERGVQLIPPEGGRAAAVDEIERGAKGEVEVILGDGPWRSAGVPEPAPSTDAEELPLLHGVTASPGGNGRVELSRVLDPERDLYLRDHQLDGHPVLPAAVAIEMMAETVRRQWPESEVIGVESFRLLNGVVLENGAKPLRITARPAARADAGADGEAIDVEIADPAGGRVFYRATCRVGPALPEAPADPDPEVADLRPFPMSVAEAYDRWLFHGPLFQGIESFEGFSDRAIAATLLPSSPGRLLRGATAPEWIFDPVLIDSAFQLTLLFSRARSDMTPLPARFRRLRRFAATNGTRLRCVVRARTDAGGHHLETQTLILNDAGRIVVSLEDAEFTASRDLNRLAGRWIRRGAE